MSSDKRHLDSFIFANGDRYDGQIIAMVMGKHISANRQFIYKGLWNRTINFFQWENCKARGTAEYLET